MNNYLVIFSSHVDSEIKKNETIETLKHLKESDIDVCLSTHSNLYLDELSQYVKFVVYDSNNEFLLLQDYIDNCKYIDSIYKYGFTSREIFHNFGRVSITIPGSPHSKCALSLLRNGVAISELNNYKWTIYLEYDIKIPKLGFKHFFDYQIDRLVTSNKKCFYYYTRSDDLNFLWGGPFVFETNPFFNNEKFMKNDWYSNKENWIKEWGVGFFESIIQYTINSVFNKDEIILETIQDNFKKFWNADNLSELGKFNYTDSFSDSHKYLTEIFKINLYPNIDIDGNRKLFLYFYNGGDKKVNLVNFLVYSNNIVHINKKNSIIDPHNWSISSIEIDELTDEDEVVLSWTGSIENKYYTNTQSIRIGNLEKIQKNIMNIKF